MSNPSNLPDYLNFELGVPRSLEDVSVTSMTLCELFGSPAIVKIMTHMKNDHGVLHEWILLEVIITTGPDGRQETVFYRLERTQYKNRAQPMKIPLSDPEVPPATQTLASSTSPSGYSASSSSLSGSVTVGTSPAADTITRVDGNVTRAVQLALIKVPDETKLRLRDVIALALEVRRDSLNYTVLANQCYRFAGRIFRATENLLHIAPTVPDNALKAGYFRPFQIVTIEDKEVEPFVKSIEHLQILEKKVATALTSDKTKLADQAATIAERDSTISSLYNAIDQLIP